MWVDNEIEAVGVRISKNLKKVRNCEITNEINKDNEDCCGDKRIKMRFYERKVGVEEGRGEVGNSGFGWVCAWGNAYPGYLVFRAFFSTKYPLFIHNKTSVLALFLAIMTMAADRMKIRSLCIKCLCYDIGTIKYRL